MKLRLFLLTLMLFATFDYGFASDDKDREIPKSSLSRTVVQYNPDFSQEFRNTAVIHFSFDAAHALINRLIPAITEEGNPILVGIGTSMQLPRFFFLAGSLFYAGQYAINAGSDFGYLLATAFIIHALGDVDDLVTYPSTDKFVGICVGLTFLIIMKTLFKSDESELNYAGAYAKEKMTRKSPSGKRKQ